MSKAALVGLVKGLARDLGPRGITINNVQPGPVDTDMNPADGEFAAQLRSQFLALPRYAHVDEIAGMVAWLAGPDVLQAAQVQLGVTYPLPQADLGVSRARALAAYARIKAG